MPKGANAILDEKPLPSGVNQAKLLSIEQLADWWGVSRKYIWQLTTQRKGAQRLPSYKMGRRRMFIYDECYYYLKKQEAN